ncbi:hypothetical protein QTP88_020755 [Uroleucon formosanum]
MAGSIPDNLAVCKKKNTFTYVPPTPPAELIEASNFTINFESLVLLIITPSRYIRITPDLLKRIFDLIGHILSFILDQPQRYSRVIFLETYLLKLSSMVHEGCRVLLNRTDLIQLKHLESSIFEAIVRKDLFTSPLVVKQIDEFGAYLEVRCSQEKSPPKSIEEMKIVVQSNPNLSRQIQIYAATQLVEIWENWKAQESCNSDSKILSPSCSPKPTFSKLEDTILAKPLDHIDGPKSPLWPIRDGLDFFFRSDSSPSTYDNHPTAAPLHGVKRRLPQSPTRLDVPKDVRTLLKTPKSKSHEINHIENGSYIHIGVEFMIKPVLQLHFDSLIHLDTLLLSVNVDGLSITNSSNFYFLLAKIICDAPAKSFLLNVKHFNAYHSCNSCIEEGTYINRRVCFLGKDALLRTNDSFRLKSDEHYHKDSCPFEELPINITSVVVLEYMHNVCLGVMKRLLQFWKNGQKPVRLLNKDCEQQISNELVNLHPHLPSEFNRLTRSVDELECWKATEYRHILLKGWIKSSLYQHVLLIHSAIKILISNETCFSLNDQANNLLKQFVKDYPNLYGGEYVTYNVHRLIHISNFVKIHGPIGS